jgi:spermidine synthase
MRRDHLLLAAFVLSGAAGLGYEILWTRLLALALGSESLGMLGVLSGFFGGLALGSWLFHDRVLASRDPARLFARLELVAAVFALASPHLLYALGRRLPPLLGPAAGDNDTFVGLALSLVTATLALLPGTVCMGATLAALVEARRRALPGDDEGRGLGRLYAANTLGATLGVAVTVYLLLPRLGMGTGSAVLSGLGLAAAGLAAVWARGRGLAAPGRASKPAKRGKRARREGQEPSWNLAIVTVTGFAGLGLEVAGVQILAQNMEDTVYTFANTLAVYLVGTAAGAWIFSALAPRLAARGRDTVTAGLLLLQVVTVALAAFVLRGSPALLEILAPSGPSYAGDVAAEAAVAAAVFLPPTLVMGALFSHVMGQVAPRGVGRAYALNTFGSMLAPFVFGLWAIRALGYAAALRLAVLAYLVLLLAFLWSRPRRAAAAPRLAAAALAVAAYLAVPGPMLLVPIAAGWTPLVQDPGLYGLVVVSEEATSTLPGNRLHRRLQVNRHFRMGGSVSFGEQRLGHLPLLFAPTAKRALFLGVGTGATLSAVRHFPLEHVDAVELVPEVLAALPYFEHVNEGVFRDPRVRFHAADARRFVAAGGERYDVIVGDLFHPARDGAGSLYAREHFRGVAARLAPGGSYAQWIPLYQFDVTNLKTVVRTFLDVFPEAHSFVGIYNAMTPALALVGRANRGDGSWPVELGHLRAQLSRPVYGPLLMADPRDVMASYMLDRGALAAVAGEGPLNTDLDPRVLFDAPRSAYENRDDLNWGSLQALLPYRTLYPEELLEADAGFRAATRRFSTALTFYLEGEVLRVSSPSSGRFPAAALDRYLAAYETAPELYPAASLLYGVAAFDHGSTEEIFRRMLERAPDDPRTRLEYLRYLEALGDARRVQEAQELFSRQNPLDREN